MMEDEGGKLDTCYPYLKIGSSYCAYLNDEVQIERRLQSQYKKNS
jgi:hypothetical protein